MKAALRLASGFLFLSFVLTGSSHTASKIPIVDWRDLSDRKLTPTGEAALQVYKEAWLHAETEHFVYHFHDPKEAETVLIHTEVYYQWIKDMFGVSADIGTDKSHIFIFDDKDLWKSFNQRTPEKLPGAEAFTNGKELFMYRESFWLEPQRVLAHEITHLILFRYVDGQVPLFLNEGFAEFMATKAIAMKADGNDYSVRNFKTIPQNEFIPLKEFTLLKDYPEGKTEVFYRQSEFLTRFLILNHPKENFYRLLRETAGGTSFEDAVEEIYSMEFETLTEKFKLYAMTRNTPNPG